MKSKNELKKDLNKATAVLNWSLKSESAAKINAMIDLARSEPGIPVLPEQMDINPWLLNCVNGTLDLRTGRLREHRREDMITKLCPTEYHLQATAPLWQKYLETIFVGNAGLIRYLQRLLGYCKGCATGGSCWKRQHSLRNCLERVPPTR
jgi:putative DNA primase/helicase